VGCLYDSSLYIMTVYLLDLEGSNFESF